MNYIIFGPFILSSLFYYGIKVIFNYPLMIGRKRITELYMRRIVCLSVVWLVTCIMSILISMLIFKVFFL